MAVYVTLQKKVLEKSMKITYLYARSKTKSYIYFQHTNDPENNLKTIGALIKSCGSKRNKRYDSTGLLSDK